MSSTDPGLEADPIDVLIFAGQSNMAALGGDSAEIPPDGWVGQVPYWWTLQGRPSAVPNTSGGRWQTLQPLDWPLPDAPGGVRLARFGPEAGFVMGLRERDPLRHVAVLKVQMGGSCLADWHPGHEFQPSGLDRILDEVPKALQAAESAGAPARVAGLVWFQGEGDSEDMVLAETYATRFRAMYAELERRLQTQPLPCVIIETRFTGRVGNATVQAAQAELAATLPLARLVSTRDLPQLDLAHFAAPEIVEIGRRTAAAWVELNRSAAPAVRAD